MLPVLQTPFKSRTEQMWKTKQGLYKTLSLELAVSGVVSPLSFLFSLGVPEMK